MVRITVSSTLCHCVTYLRQALHSPLVNIVPTALDLVPAIILNPRARLEWDTVLLTPLNQSILPPRAASIPKQTTFSPASYRIKLPYWSITVSKVLGKMLNHPPPYNTYTHPAPHPATLTDIRVWAAAQPAKCHFLCLLVYKYEDMRKFHSKTFIAQ